MCLASSVSWLVKPESLVISMLLFVLHELWSIIDDSGSVVSSVVPSHPALLSFHMLAGNLDRALPYHYALAEAFTICDNDHCSVRGPTDPNRSHVLMLLGP